MKRSRFAGLVALVGVLAASSFAATATAAPRVAQSRAEGQPNTLSVHFAVKKFFVQGNALLASGDVIAIYTAADGSNKLTQQPFVSRVRTITAQKPMHATAPMRPTTPTTRTQPVTPMRTVQSAATVCSVLNLNLGPLHLALLGLIVDLDKVHLTINADSNGGLLGSLLCGGPGGLGGLGGLLGGLGGLTGGSGAAASPTAATTAARLTQAARQSGLAAGPGFQLPISAAANGAVRTTQALPPVPTGVCTVLDLPLGPLDLNLLGLMVHLDATELRITADPTGGLLGRLLCGGLGGILGGAATPTTAG